MSPIYKSVIIIGSVICLSACSASQLFHPTVTPIPMTVTLVTSQPTVEPSAMVTADYVTPLVASSPTAAIPIITATAEATLSPAIPIADARAATSRELFEVVPPERDDIALAVAYLGADPIVATPQLQPILEPGAIDSFYIGNVDSNTVSRIDAELMSVGENAYFWFDTGPGSVNPDQTLLAKETAAFDEIYETLFAYFGLVEPPGGRVHIVHASPNVLCDDPDYCRLAGYFSSRDLIPRSIDPQSNERAMFVMNTRQFGTDNYLDVLAHELRHMLGEEYDGGDEDWVVEGGALLAEDLAGFSLIPQARGNLFLENPDQQLNSWTEGNTIPHYGQGYLVSRYLYDRLGASLFRKYLDSRHPGLSAVDDVSAESGLDFTGLDLWVDWLATMALHDVPDLADEYRWSGPELSPVAMTDVNTIPATFDTTVSQFAADYYELPSSGEFAVDFSGAQNVSLLGTDAFSGESFWYANRANDSNPRLTRVVDLRDVDKASLRYQVFADIEHGYDFAYVSVSTDGGKTWQGLSAENMQGQAQVDDPADRALTERFYTGRLGRWMSETIDLSHLAGQEILIRFEYVTDPILTYGGFALDDITIPEIGFFDDAETLDDGWIAEGFTRATADLPQSWWLQLITFDADGRPTIERLPVPESGQFAFSYQALPGDRRPILIVAATAPETLQAANYGLDVTTD